MALQLAQEEPEAGPWRAGPLTAVIEALVWPSPARPVAGRPVVLAVDGRSNAGKTTLSRTDTCPRRDYPVTAVMTTHPAHPPRFTPAPAPIPRAPAAGDHQWPDQWPLRTQLELAALDTAPGCARAHVCAVLHEWHADADFTDMAA